MVLAPEHPLVDALTAPTVAARARRSAGPAAPPVAAGGGRGVPSGRRRKRSSWTGRPTAKAKTGVFTGAFATNPVNGAAMPVFIADYVLIGLRHRRDHGACPARTSATGAFAEALRLPDRPDRASRPRAGDGEAVHSVTARRSTRQRRVSLNGLGRRRGQGADHRLARGARRGPGRDHLQAARLAVLAGSGTGASRSRSSTTSTACRSRCPESMLPVELPEMADFRPAAPTTRTTATASRCRPCRAPGTGSRSTLDLGDGEKTYRRELNIMPQWAGSCWYEIRYPDPDQRRAVRRPGERALLDGAAVARRPRRRRPVRRRGRAGGPAPALRPLLAEGAPRPGPCQRGRAVPSPVQPGVRGGGRLHRRPWRPCARGRGRGPGRRLVLARRPGSTGSTARWARA